MYQVLVALARSLFVNDISHKVFLVAGFIDDWTVLGKFAGREQ
jgi:uncharacterized membrane protein YkvA (DUF1232 family)